MEHGETAAALYLVTHESRHGRAHVRQRAIETGLAAAEIADRVIAGDLLATPDGDLVTAPRAPSPGYRASAQLVVGKVAHDAKPRPLRSWIESLGSEVHEIVMRTLLDEGLIAHADPRPSRSRTTATPPVVDHEHGWAPGLRLRAMMRRPTAFTLPAALVLSVLCAVGAETLLEPHIAAERSRRLAALAAGLFPGPVRGVLAALRRSAGLGYPEAVVLGGRAEDVFSGSSLADECAAVRKRMQEDTEAIRATLRDRHDRVAALVRDGDVELRPGSVGELEDVVRLAETVLGRADPDSVVANGTLALVCLCCHQDDRGLALLYRNRLARESTFGRDHPLTLIAGDAIAKALRDGDQLERALKTYRAVVAHRTARFGPTHPDTIASRAASAATACDAGFPSSADGVLVTVLDDARRTLGDAHPVTRYVTAVHLDCRDTLDALYRPLCARHQLRPHPAPCSDTEGFDH